MKKQYKILRHDTPHKTLYEKMQEAEYAGLRTPKDYFRAYILQKTGMGIKKILIINEDDLDDPQYFVYKKNLY